MYLIDKGVYGFLPHDLARLSFAKGGLITNSFGGSLARPRTVSPRIRIKILRERSSCASIGPGKGGE